MQSQQNTDKRFYESRQTGTKVQIEKQIHNTMKQKQKVGKNPQRNTTSSDIKTH